MAPVIDFRRNRLVRRASELFAQLSLRARIAGTMIALLAMAGLILSALGLSRRRTAQAQHHPRPALRRVHAFRAAYARGSRRRAAAFGALEYLSIQRSLRAAATHRHAQARRDASSPLGRATAGRAGARWQLRPAVYHLRRDDLCHAGKDRHARAGPRRVGRRDLRRPRGHGDFATAGRAHHRARRSTHADRSRPATRAHRCSIRGQRARAHRAIDRYVHGTAGRFRRARTIVHRHRQPRITHSTRGDAWGRRAAGNSGGRPAWRKQGTRTHSTRRA